MSLVALLSFLKSAGRALLYRSTYWVYSRLFSQRPGLIVFLSDSNATLVGNQEAIAQELTARGYGYQTVLRADPRERRGFREYHRLFALISRAPVIVLDDFYPLVYQLNLRPRTELLQVWHASGAFKTMGFSRVGKPGGPNPKSRSHRNYTSVIVSSPHVKKDWAEAFGIDINRVHATGIPRTDPFFNSELVTDTAVSVRKDLGLPASKKLILFAPTFRGNGQLSAHYNLEWINWKQLADQLGDKYVFAVKLHPFVDVSKSEIFEDDRFLNLSDYKDTNSLLMATDLLITDYSSIIFDFSLLARPTIFFCPDLDEYVASRDFYYPFSDYAFGPIATNSRELLQQISARTMEQVNLDLTRFVEYFSGACDGASTQRVVDQIILPSMQLDR